MPHLHAPVEGCLLDPAKLTAQGMETGNRTQGRLSVKVSTVQAFVKLKPAYDTLMFIQYDKIM